MANYDHDPHQGYNIFENGMHSSEIEMIPVGLDLYNSENCDHDSHHPQRRLRSHFISSSVIDIDSTPCENSPGYSPSLPTQRTLFYQNKESLPFSSPQAAENVRPQGGVFMLKGCFQNLKQPHQLSDLSLSQQ